MRGEKKRKEAPPITYFNHHPWEKKMDQKERGGYKILTLMKKKKGREKSENITFIWMVTKKKITRRKQPANNYRY